MTMPSRVASLAIFATLVFAGCGHPSEVRLRRSFGDHEAEYTRLLTMAREDRELTRIAPTFTVAHGSGPSMDGHGITRERWNEYRRLFKVVGAKDGLTQDEDACSFTVSAEGLAVHGSAKGIIYSRKKPVPIMSSVDSWHGVGVAYSHIKNDWYVFYQRD